VHAEYVSAPPGDVAKLGDAQRWLAPLFERRGVKLVLTGHEHNFVRSVRLIGGRERRSGVTYVITGGGGAALDPLPPAPSPVTAARGSFFHHLLISVTGREMRVSTIDTSGQVRDRFRLTCGGGRPATRSSSGIA
jgi:hypothetical protein